MRIAFDGSRSAPPRGEAELLFRSHYFIGNDPARWRTDVRSFGVVAYRELYPGIDLIYGAAPGGLKYEIRASPGADLPSVLFRFDGVDDLRIDGGALVLATPAGEIRDSAPVSYLDTGEPVSCAFALRGPRSVGFKCPGWNGLRALIIDPTFTMPLLYGAYLGGGGVDRGNAIAVDSLGHAYVAGRTQSPTFPVTVGSFDLYLNGSSDAFVAKVAPDGGSLIHVTYLGGNGSDEAAGIAVDASGYVYLAGRSNSPDFPTSAGAIDSVAESMDAFVAKLNPTGSVLLYSTLLGGVGTQAAAAIAVGAGGRAYVTGFNTPTGEFPTTPGAFVSGRGAWVAKLGPWGDYLVYGGFVGGDFGTSIAVDGSGAAVVVGHTGSSGFPATTGAFDPTLNGSLDVFVTKLLPDGTDLEFATLLGGGGEEYGLSVALDASGNVFVAGQTSSSDFPTGPNGLDARLDGISDGFVAKLSPDGGRLIYGTYVGGSDEDAVRSVAVDGRGRAYAAGFTLSRDLRALPFAPGPSNNGEQDAFVWKLAPDGGSLFYASYLGGPANDTGNAVAVDGSDGVYVTGVTQSDGFPTTPAGFDPFLDGIDAFVLKLDLHLPDLSITPDDIQTTPGDPVADGTSVIIQAMVTNMGDADASDVVIRVYDGPSSGALQIGPDQVLASLPAGGGGMVSVPWTAGPPGLHWICVLADGDDAVPEPDEANNEACIPFDVVAAPGPDLSIASADLAPPPSPWVNGTVVIVTATVRNLGTETSGSTTVRFYDGAPPDPPAQGELPLPALAKKGEWRGNRSWTVSVPGDHSVCVEADPGDTVVEANESNNRACVSVRVLDRPDYVPTSPLPVSPASVGLSRPVNLAFVVTNQGGSAPAASSVAALFNASTPSAPFARLTVPALDPGETAGPFVAEWRAPGTMGTHRVTARVDFDGNITEADETNNEYTWVVEVVEGPTTRLVIGVPNYGADRTFVTPSTPLEFLVDDRGGTGVRSTRYRVDGADWRDFLGAPVRLTGKGLHTLEWFSEDNAGNVEPVRTASLEVDDTPPETSLLPTEAEVPADTAFALTASDLGSGVARIEVRIDGRAWETYAAPFSLSPGVHTIGYRSVDNLGNVEPEGLREVEIGSASGPPPQEAPTNLKPVVAAVLAAVLAAVGAWSSVRAPSRRRKGEGSVKPLPAFARNTLPFVALEVATGIVSMFTGSLAIPPVLGIGTTVDVVVFVVGVGVSVRRLVVRTPAL